MNGSLDRAVFAAGVLCLACAPWSWVDDGVTPSWVVFPLFVAAGLWRLTQGKGRLWLAVTSTVFVLVHVPWTWVALSGGEHPTSADADVNAVQWFVTLFVVPVVLAGLAWAAWRKQRRRVPAQA